MREFDVTQPIEVVPNGIDLEPFWHPPGELAREDLGIPEGVPLLIYVGRLASEKRVAQLVSQFSLSREIIPELQLLLVGQGPGLNAIRTQVEKLGLAGAVHCPGAVPFSQVGDAMALADAFVTASVSEVHPLTVIEAMASGLPVVAVASPGINDTVNHGQTGLLASTGDGLAAAIVGLMSDPERRTRMSKEARVASEQYDIRRTVERTLGLYRRLRESRPDLQRRRKHGRWLLPSPPPLLEQLARTIRPPE
jgi:glycosyltransferase involved in cell wall biosynthesis